MFGNRFSVVVLLAILVAGGAGYGVYHLIQKAQAEARVPTVDVVVAAADLTEGHIVEAGDLKVIDVPVAAAAVDAFNDPDSVVGRVTRVPVFEGEALLPGRLAPKGSGAGIEVKIAPGKRAMAVKIDEVAGLAGLIQPNSRVDVLVTIVDGSGAEQQRAKVILHNMRVLSIGSQVERGADGATINATTAALEVTPEEAEELAIASNQGRIQLVLRGYGDPDTVRTRGATVRDLMRSGSSETSAPAPARPQPRRAAPRQRVAAAPANELTPVVVPTTPRRPDTAVVQVYRRAQVSQQRVQRRDSTP